MRKLSFTNGENDNLKLMIYKTGHEVYLFGYNGLEDHFSNWDLCFPTLEEAEDYCLETHFITPNDWISIPDPEFNCQHDFIMPVMKQGNILGKFLKLIGGNWHENTTFEKHLSFNGLTVNERLFITGLLAEFDRSEANDKKNAEKILKALQVDAESIKSILG